MSGKLSGNTNAVVNEVKQEDNQKANKTKPAKALPEVAPLRATNIRKTSISMPSKLDEMDDLRIDRQNVSRNSSIVIAIMSMRDVIN
jgi:hypothetical protein